MNMEIYEETYSNEAKLSPNQANQTEEKEDNFTNVFGYNFSLYFNPNRRILKDEGYKVL